VPRSEYVACVQSDSVRIQAPGPARARLSVPLQPRAGLTEIDRALEARGWRRVSDWVIEDGHAHARLVCDADEPLAQAPPAADPAPPAAT
jgi:hypothetical protein